MEISPAVDPLSLSDFTHFFNAFEEDDAEFQQFIDATYAEQLQLEEALKASLLTPHMPAEMKDESSLGFCHCCNERKENDQLIKTQKCKHFVCFDCSLIEMGKCQLPSCDLAPKSGVFKEFLPKDLIFLWGKAASADPVTNLNCSNRFPSERSTNLIIPRTKNKEATAAKWRGLREDKEDHEIVWPPMVVISYTLHKTDENSEWIGVANRELMEMFSSYNGITKAQQCHHIEAYCGMSILVFESSVLGYLEAQRLHKRFVDEKTDRNAWNSRSVHILSEKEKQLYGYLALKQDVDTFNNHFEGMEKLDYEMRSYQEMAVNQIKQIPIKNRQLVLLRQRVDEHERQAKDSEELCDMLREKLKLAKEESNIMRRKVTEQHKEHMEEIESQEQFYMEKIRNILESRNGKYGDSEKTKRG